MNKILLVDDDRELTSLLKELLEMEGFNVIVAHDGEQALDLLDDSIDLLLLDVNDAEEKWYRHIKSTSPDTPDACHYVDGARQ